MYAKPYNMDGLGNTKIKKIFLHVGMHKTGTSSIQETLFANRHLFESDFFYPASWGINHTFFIKPLFGNSNSNQGNGFIQYDKNIKQEYTQMLMDEIKSTTCSKLIISAECVCILDKTNIIKLKQYLSKLFPIAEIEIIMFVRNTKEWTTSMLQELVKSPGKTSKQEFESIIGIIGDLFESRIKKIRSVFGKERMTVIKFEEACSHPFGIVGSFLNAVEIENELISKIEIIRANKSLSTNGVILINYINENYPRSKNEKVNIGRMINDTMPIYQIRGEKYLLSQQQYEEIDEKSEADRRWLLKNYNIDYSAEITGGILSDVNYDANYYNDFTSVMAKSTDTIKYLMYQFLIAILEQSDIGGNKYILKRIIKHSKRKYNKLLSMKSIEQVVSKCDSLNDDVKLTNDNHMLFYKLKKVPTNFSSDISKISHQDGVF